MKRIDTINARENMFGVGKSGFHDNEDLPGQDATYVSPEWFNTVQEELCNLLELRGIALSPDSNDNYMIFISLDEGAFFAWMKGWKQLKIRDSKTAELRNQNGKRVFADLLS